jgi:hypothetical protein
MANLIVKGIRYVFGINKPNLSVAVNGIVAPEVCSIFYSYTDSTKIIGTLQLCDGELSSKIEERIKPRYGNTVKFSYKTDLNTEATVEFTGVSFTGIEKRAFLDNAEIVERLVFTAKRVTNVNAAFHK